MFTIMGQYQDHTETFSENGYFNKKKGFEKVVNFSRGQLTIGATMFTFLDRRKIGSPPYLLLKLGGSHCSPKYLNI